MNLADVLKGNPEATRQFIRSHMTEIVETALDPTEPEATRRERWDQLYVILSKTLQPEDKPT